MFTVPNIVLRFGILLIVDALALWLTLAFWGDGNIALAITLALVTIVVNVINLRPDLYPLRWMSPGLALMILFVVYPLIFTIYVAFTNMGTGHLLAKEQAIQRIEQNTFLPEDAQRYRWTAYQNEAGEFALWLVSTDDPDEVYFAVVGAPLEAVVPGESGENPDEDGIPESINGYTRLAPRDMLGALRDLEPTEFGEAPDIVRIDSASSAGRFESRYAWDPGLGDSGAFVDQQTGRIYYADEERGDFVAAADPQNELEEAIINPGYQVTVGLDNFIRFFTSESLRGPLFTVFVWTIIFALGSVITTFSLGLGLALVLNDTIIPARKLFRSLLIIPYAVPGVISVLVWQGMLNPNLGVVTTNLRNIFGVDIPWFSDPFWVKIAVLMVNLWLGFPYMMLLCSGALQAIPSDIYEAAEVDGANGWQRFWGITLPLLLISVGPLLISSFTFNFNNFVLIEALTGGGPPIPNTLTPAGYSDILISYTYRLAFGSGRGADYGLASAITIVIFVIVASITLLNFRFTRQWEEASENV